MVEEHNASFSQLFTGKADFCARRPQIVSFFFGDGTADLQVAEGGASDGRRRPERRVIYSVYFNFEKFQLRLKFALMTAAL